MRENHHAFCKENPYFIRVFEFSERVSKNVTKDDPEDNYMLPERFQSKLRGHEIREQVLL